MDDVLPGSHNMLNRWKNYFCQILNVYGTKGARQTEILRADSLTAELSPPEVDLHNL
jgi:hypothetical protein